MLEMSSTAQSDHSSEITILNEESMEEYDSAQSYVLCEGSLLRRYLDVFLAHKQWSALEQYQFVEVVLLRID